MRALICWLRGHDWTWLCDLMVKDGKTSSWNPLGQDPSQAGFYQCPRCKAITLGGARQRG